MVLVHTNISWIKFIQGNTRALRNIQIFLGYHKLTGSAIEFHPVNQKTLLTDNISFTVVPNNIITGEFIKFRNKSDEYRMTKGLQKWLYPNKYHENIIQLLADKPDSDALFGKVANIIDLTLSSSGTNINSNKYHNIFISTSLTQNPGELFKLIIDDEPRLSQYIGTRYLSAD